jgi:16S rRNA G1207 methylase RsmC
MLAWLRRRFGTNARLTVTFDSPSIRAHFRKLAGELGHDEHALAKRLLTNFIGYCEEQRPERLRKESA